MVTEKRACVQIFMRSMDEMDQADQELRQAISHTWPFTKRDGKLELLVPPPTRKRSITPQRKHFQCFTGEIFQ